MEPSDTELVERCLHNDTSAWHQLVDRYANLVHSVPVRYGLTPAEVDDVGQEVFFALAQNLHQIEDPARLSGWLATTARRLSWRALRTNKREQPVHDADLADSLYANAPRFAFSTLPTVDELFASWSRQEEVQQGLVHLSDRCYRLLYLLFLDPTEPSYDAISQQLDLPTGSIGPTRNRCLKQLRSILEGLGFARDA